MAVKKIQFLITLASAIRNGAVKTIQQAMAFAKREFGEIDKSFVDDIVNVFKKEGKIKKKGDVVPIKKQEGIKSTQEYKDMVEELRNSEIGNTYTAEELEKAALDMIKIRNKNKIRLEADQDIADIQKSIDDLDAAEAEADAFSILDDRTKDIAKGDPTGETSDLMKGLEDKAKKIKKAADEMKKVADEPGFTMEIAEGSEKGKKITIDDFLNMTGATPNPFRNPKVGMVRTAAREILEKNKIKIGREDPIEVLRKTYGENVLEAVDAIGDDLLNTKTYGEINELLKKNNLFDLVPKKTYGYDQSVVSAEKIRKAKEQEAKQRQILEEFDPTDRTRNAHGGLIDILKL